MRELLLIGLLVALPLHAAEKGYRIDHPDGSVEYTDQPGPDAKEVRLPEISTFPGESAPAPSFSPQQSPSTSIEKKDSIGKSQEYTTFALRSPENEQTVWFDANGMNVVLEIVPAIAEGDKVLVSIDDKIVATGSAANYQIKDVFRGAHTLTAVIENSQGITVKEAGPIVFYLRQHSRLQSQDPLN